MNNITRESTTNTDPAKLPLHVVIPSPLNPRQHFDPVAMEELTNSVRMLGVQQPITVRPLPPDTHGEVSFEIVMGHRRYEAAKRAEVDRIPALIRYMNDAEVISVALAENLHRSDLLPLEEARGYALLLEKESGLTQGKLAARFGKSQPHVANYLRLLKLPESVRDILMDGLLSASHGIALCGLLDWPTSIEVLAKKAISESMSLAYLEAEVRGVKQHLEAKKQPSLLDAIEETPVVAVEPTPATVTPAPQVATAPEEEKPALFRRPVDDTPVTPQPTTPTIEQPSTPAPAPKPTPVPEAKPSPAATESKPAAPAPPPAPASVPEVAPASKPVEPKPSLTTDKPVPAPLPVPATRKPVTGLLWEDQQEWLAGQGLSLFTGLDRLRTINIASDAYDALLKVVDYYNGERPGERPLLPGEVLDSIILASAKQKGLISHG